MSNKKSSRVTREQLMTMLDYFAANPGLAEGKTRALLGKKEANKKWEEMATLLHEAEGPEKTVEQWQVVWRDLKSRTNIKVKECRHRMARGEDISANSTFTDLELRVVDILGADEVENVKDDSMERKEKRKRSFMKSETTNDSFDDPLTMQQQSEQEEYIDDDDYAESYRALSSKKLKPSHYASIANALNSSSHISLDGDSRSSFTQRTHESPQATKIEEFVPVTKAHETVDIVKIQAEAMMMQAEAAKISAEAAKMNSEAAKIYASAAKSNAEALNKIAEAFRLAAEAFANRQEEHL